jgi:hypothetical protein
VSIIAPSGHYRFRPHREHDVQLQLCPDGHRRTLTRRVAKQGGDVAEEFFNDASRLIERQPILTVAATAALALGAGVFIGWMMQRKGSR